MQKKGLFYGFFRRFFIGVGLSLLLFLLPLCALPAAREAPLPVLTPEPSVPVSAVPQEEGWDGAHRVRVLRKDGMVEDLALSDYLWRVVAAEMPAAFEEEALKAQAVCARTYTLWKLARSVHEGADICADSACCQAYITPAEAAEKWGERAVEYNAKIARAVAETDGRVLTYEGELIQAVFFSSSTYTTEDAAAVWGNALPYLVSVESPEGEEVPNYRSTVTLTAEQLGELAASVGAVAPAHGETWFADVHYTASGRVADLTFGGVTLSGGTARSLFGLRSACFTVREEDGTVTFSVTGYGHGVGMSQYGANAMAKEGAAWQDIVTHYYTGVTVEYAPG